MLEQSENNLFDGADDVFYIDDQYEKYPIHEVVATVVKSYAIQRDKKIIMNGNRYPSQLGLKLVSPFRVVEVKDSTEA